jgi:hypothetical protein
MARLLDEGKIPGRTVGKYRRVRIDDLMAVRRQRESLRNPARTAAELLATFERKGLPKSVARLTEFTATL